MNDLNYYYSALFDESKYYDKWHEVFHFGILSTMVVSIFTEGLFLYVIGVIGLLAQIGLFISKYFSDRSQSLAHHLQRISMLNNAFENKSHDFDVSQIKGKISLRAHKIVKAKMDKKDDSTEYNPPSATTGLTKLKFMIQENAYWNHHLFEICSRKGWMKFYLFLGAVITAILLSMTVTSGITSDPNYSVPRLALIFLSFLRIWEELEKVLIWQGSSQTMFSIDSSLNSFEESDAESAMLIFSEYNIAKAKTSTIPRLS